MCACEDQRGWSPHYSLPYFLRWRLLLSPGRTDWLDWLPSRPKGSSAFCPSTVELQTTPSFLTGALGIWTLALPSQHFIYWSIPQPRRWEWKISKLVSKPFKITFQLPSDSGSGATEVASLMPDWPCDTCDGSRGLPSTRCPVTPIRMSRCHTHTQDGLFLQSQTVG